MKDHSKIWRRRVFHDFRKLFWSKNLQLQDFFVNFENILVSDWFSPNNFCYSRIIKTFFYIPKPWGEGSIRNIRKTAFRDLWKHFWIKKLSLLSINLWRNIYVNFEKTMLFLSGSTFIYFGILVKGFQNSGIVNVSFISLFNYQKKLLTICTVYIEFIYPCFMCWFLVIIVRQKKILLWCTQLYISLLYI